MATLPDISPLELQRSGNHLRFVLKPQDEILPELPADFEELLAHSLADVFEGAETVTAEIDLGQTPALSSRQLGSLIALRKVLRERFDRVPIHGVSGSVRHLLELTRTDQFFEVE